MPTTCISLSAQPTATPARHGGSIPADPYTLLSTADVLRLIGVSRVTLWRWTHVGFFPRPDKLLRGNPPRKAWLRSTVETWLTAESIR